MSTKDDAIPQAVLDVAESPLSLDTLLEKLYAASSCSNRSRMAPALDSLLTYVDYWRAKKPELVALFERLEPSRLARAVGQTLLASTSNEVIAGEARRAFLSRFLEDLRIRSAPQAIIARLRRELES